MLPNRRSVFSGRCGRLSLSFGSATLGLGRLVRPFHPGLSVWVTVHVFVLSFMFSLGGTFTLRAARLSLAHRTLTQPPERGRSPPAARRSVEGFWTIPESLRRISRCGPGRSAVRR